MTGSRYETENTVMGNNLEIVLHTWVIRKEISSRVFKNVLYNDIFLPSNQSVWLICKILHRTSHRVLNAPVTSDTSGEP